MISSNSAQAVWSGDIKSGKGNISAASGAIEALAYDFGKRFAGEPGTNPEELIAAAHAGCFSMALSGQLTNAGHPPEEIETKATVTLERVDEKPTVTKVHLDVRAKVPGATEEAFQTAAGNAKAGCPISRLLNTEITMDAKLA
ncbi:OsmC family protein [Alkalilacustris brevis]|uniref:OsmC family protein n=1 Tax=Alkalilacustris brevis TaxID=2026338 RepID=UPI000E0DF4EA|nr:OsmC family protein [Alkalilacustris brevis]